MTSAPLTRADLDAVLAILLEAYDRAEPETEPEAAPDKAKRKRRPGKPASGVVKRMNGTKG